MSQRFRPNRCSFIRRSVGLAALGSIACIPGGQSAANPSTTRLNRKTKIRIGTRINPAWLRSERDNDLRFLKQIGVDYVDIELIMVKGYPETGCFTTAALQELVGRFRAVGLQIERANALGPFVWALGTSPVKTSSRASCTSASKANFCTFAFATCAAR